MSQVPERFYLPKSNEQTQASNTSTIRSLPGNFPGGGHGGGNGDPLAFAGPSMRTQAPPLRQAASSEDTRARARSAVRQAAARSTDRPFTEQQGQHGQQGPERQRERGRGRSAAPPPVVTQPAPAVTQPAAGTPTRGRPNVDIEYQNGFSYVDTHDQPEPQPRRSQSSSRTAVEAAVDPFSTSGGRGQSHSRTRGGSFSSGKPRGLSFYDAREYMRSGRGTRPGSWQDAPNGQAAAAEAASQREPLGGRDRSRSRSPRDTRNGRRSWDRRRDEEAAYSDVDLGDYDDGEPPSPPRHGHRRHHGDGSLSPSQVDTRVGWSLFLNSSAKNHFVAMLGELIGTTMFLFFAFAATEVAGVNSPSAEEIDANIGLRVLNVGKLMYISFAFGFSLMVNVWIFFRVSGGLFNPAVTLALLLTGAIDFVRAICLLIAQIAGGIAASALTLGLFPTALSVQTTITEGVSIPRALFIEAILTAELVFTILMLAKEKHKATFIAPLGIGFALFIAELVGVYWTGGSLNPTRSFGPDVVSGAFATSHWVYWAGPTIGSLIAVAVYKIFKALEFELANPGQDADGNNDPSANPYNVARERQRRVTQKVLRSLGVEPGMTEYAYGPVGYDGDSIGVINMWHKNPDVAVKAVGASPTSARRPMTVMGGNAPAFGPLGTPIRQTFSRESPQ